MHYDYTNHTSPNTTNGLKKYYGMGYIFIMDQLLQHFVKTILIVFFFVASSHCEPGCVFKSFRDICVFDCGYSNLTTVPSFINNHQIQVLNLRYNKLSILRSYDFVYYFRLEKLDLRGNELRSIEELTFAGLPRLRKLDLSDNFIRYVHPNSWGPVAITLARLSLSMNALGELPNLSTMVTLHYLNASHNPQLRHIEPGSFPSSLSQLDLHYTGIRFISRSLFQNLNYLKRLHLQDMTSSSALCFEDGAFDNLTRLQHLDLSRTFCKKLPTNSFRKLKNLRTLRMKNCWLSEMPQLFAQHQKNATKTAFFTPKLQELDLSTNRRMGIYDDDEHQRFPSSLRILSLARVKLPKIDSSLFRNMKKLQVLDIRQSKVKTIAVDAFKDLESIQELLLSVNPFEQGPTFPQELYSFNISFTHLKSITVEMMKKLCYATEVNMSGNEIESIEPGSLHNLTSLRYLDLSRNKLRSVGNISIGSSAPYGKSASKSPFQNLDCLEKLLLNSNHIEELLDEDFKGLTKLQILDLSDNMLTTVRYATLRHLINLKELHLNNNDILSFAIVKSPNLQYLDLSQNQLQELPVWKENNLKILKAHENELTTIKAASFDGLVDIEEINLAKNQIHVIDYKAFANALVLSHLDLSRNEIDNFLDVRIPNLQLLRLSDNKLTKLGGKLEELCPLLRTLELIHNKISYIDPAVFEGVFSLTLVDFSFNVFECDCNLKPFLYWMDQNADIVVDGFSYFCTLPEINSMVDVVRDLKCGGEEEATEREMNDASDSGYCICLDM